MAKKKKKTSDDTIARLIALGGGPGEDDIDPTPALTFMVEQRGKAKTEAYYRKLDSLLRRELRRHEIHKVATLYPPVLLELYPWYFKKSSPSKLFCNIDTHVKPPLPGLVRCVAYQTGYDFLGITGLDRVKDPWTFYYATAKFKPAPETLKAKTKVDALLKLGFTTGQIQEAFGFSPELIESARKGVLVGITFDNLDMALAGYAAKAGYDWVYLTDEPNDEIGSRLYAVDYDDPKTIIPIGKWAEVIDIRNTPPPAVASEKDIKSAERTLRKFIQVYEDGVLPAYSPDSIGASMLHLISKRPTSKWDTKLDPRLDTDIKDSEVFFLALAAAAQNMGHSFVKNVFDDNGTVYFKHPLKIKAKKKKKRSK